MKEHYTADNPINGANDDKFQRYPFSKRIAETIVSRTDKESLVIGIYGNWGEGKTSVLNFIESNLTGKENIVVCKFNPWRFKDETDLLNGFFSLLASELQKSLVKKHEKVANLLSDYVEGLNSVIGSPGGIGKIVQKLLRKAGTVSVEERKRRIELFLEEEKRRIVVFIDDIDRLEKKEIQSIFRLIKLTADFNYTSYILAFDDKMVANAIGEIYGEGNEEAGRNFLEKIIQVPLRLPAAQKEALKNFCFKQVENAIESNKIELSQEDASSFGGDFVSFILPKLETPRMAIRYGNALAFAMPLLYKEANIVDVMLFESIKVFYPKLYDFIRLNPDYFIRGYNSRHSSREAKDEDRKKKLKEEIVSFSKFYYDEKDETIQKLLIEMFPILKEVYHNYVHNERSYNTWHHERRIGSPQYFHRYFTYAVIEGEISDVEFDEYLNQLSTKSQSENIEITKEYLDKVKPNSFAHKILRKVDKLPGNLSSVIAKSISGAAAKFPSSRRSVFSIDTPFGLAGYIVFKIIEEQKNEIERYELAKEIVVNIANLDFSFEIMRSFRNDADKEPDDSVITHEHFSELSLMLLDRTLQALEAKPIFEVYPEQTSFLLSKTWARLKGKESLMEYIQGILSKEPEKIYLLLKSFCNFIHSSGHPDPYYGDLEKQTFDWIDKVYDTEYLYRIAIKLIGEQNDYEYLELEHRQTDENRLKQFMYFYNQKNNRATGS